MLNREVLSHRDHCTRNWVSQSSHALPRCMTFHCVCFQGRSKDLSEYFRVARNTLSTWFDHDPTGEEVEVTLAISLIEQLSTSYRCPVLPTRVCL